MCKKRGGYVKYRGKRIQRTKRGKGIMGTVGRWVSKHITKRALKQAAQKAAEALAKKAARHAVDETAKWVKKRTNWNNRGKKKKKSWE